MHRIIDIYSPFAKATAQTIQTVGFLRGSNKWIVASFAFVMLWLFLVYIRNNTNQTSFWSSEKVFLGSIIIGVFVLRLPVLAYTHIDVDESEWIVGAATFFNDPRFWLSVDGTTSGPLVIVPLSIIPLFGGSLSYVSVRLFATVFYLIPTVLIVYLSVKKLYGKQIAEVIILPLAFLFGTANSLVAYSGEYSIILLSTLCIFLYSRWSAILPSLQYLFWSGFAIGLLAYTKPQAIPVGMFIALVSLWKINLEDRHWRTSLIFVLGGLVPTLLVFGYVISSNLWLDFSNAYIVNNLNYGSTSGIMGNDLSASVLMLKIKQYLNFVDEYTYWLLSGQIAAVLAIVVGVNAWLNKNYKSHFNLTFFGLLFFVAIFCTVKPKTFFYHYQNMLLVPVAFVVAAALYYLQQMLVNMVAFRHLLITFLVFNLFITALLTVPPEYTQLRLNTKKATASEFTRTIEQFTDPNDKMAVWGWNTPIFLETGLLQGTRDGHTHYHMSPIPLQKYYINRYRSDLERNRPEVIVETFAGYSSLVFGADGRKEFGLEHFPVIFSYVKTHYELKADIDGQTRIFVRKK